MLLLKAPRLLVEVTRVGRLRGCLSPNWQAAGGLAVLLGALVAQVAGAAEPERVALQGYGLRSVELAQGRLWTPSSASRPLPPLPRVSQTNPARQSPNKVRPPQSLPTAQR